MPTSPATEDRIARSLVLAAFCAGVALALTPIAQAASPVLDEQYVLTASDRVPGQLDAFGFWVAADGDRAVIGAPFDDDLGADAGAAYVFERAPATGLWTEVIKITAADGGAGDLFGRYVAIDGERLVAGALGAEAAYVFERAPATGQWAEVAKLTANDAGPDRSFGFAVAVSGERVAVGANFDGDAGSEAGAVYVFALASPFGPPSWVQVTKLLGSAPSTGARLGGRLALDGETLVATAPGDTNAVGSVAGATYVFERDLGGPDVWGERIKLLGPATSAVAGSAVALEGDQLLAAAMFDSSVEVSGGSAQLYHRNVGGPEQWGETTPLTAVDASPQDRFGVSAELVGGHAAVGAQFTATPAGADAGAVHVFGLRPNGEWKPITVLATSDGTNSQTFAQSIAIGGGPGAATLLLAAPANEGSVYVFDLGRIILSDGFETGDLESWLSAMGSPP